MHEALSTVSNDKYDNTSVSESTYLLLIKKCLSCVHMEGLCQGEPSRRHYQEYQALFLMPSCGSAHLTCGFILVISRPGSIEGCANFQQIKELLLIPLENKESLLKKGCCRHGLLGRTIYLTSPHVK